MIIQKKHIENKDAHDIFINNEPVPMIELSEFIEDSLAIEMYRETHNIDERHWKHFTRNGSSMMECNKIDLMPIAFKFVSYMHSSTILKWLESVTGVKKLIPDPHLIGGGYSKSFQGDSLKIHTDFNWNEELGLHRALSLILYLTPSWKEEWGGSLDFYDFNRENIIKSIPCLHNNCVIWQYHKRGFHGYSEPLSCPENFMRTTFRLFYYVSDSVYHADDQPHRSLYWIDPITKEPYDDRKQK